MRINQRGKATWIDRAVASSTDECIIWPWGLVEGYGRAKRDGKDRLVHVIVCELAHGPRPQGLEVAHSCGQRACANPRHLRWATRANNHADKLRHGTHMRGERLHGAKLTWEQVEEIRSLYAAGDHRLLDLALLYDVSISNIQQIVTYQTWVIEQQPPQPRSTS
jgi:hypothetical protein